MPAVVSDAADGFDGESAAILIMEQLKRMNIILFLFFIEQKRESC